MRRTKIYVVTAAALLALAGCDHALEPAGGSAITIEASVGPMTKVTYDGAGAAFAAGDQLALYAWTGTATEIPARRAVDGVVNTFDGSKWTPASLMRWQTMSTPHFFLGVSPAPGAAVADLTAVPYTLDPADYTASDLLLARNFGTDGAGVKPSATAVPLAFDHAMAKLVVNLKFRSQWAAVPAVSALTVTAKSAATVNYLTKSVSATGTAAPVDVPAATSIASGYDKSYSGLQVPQSGVRRITVNVGGTDFVYESTDDIPLVSGEITTVSLNVGRDRIDLGSVTIKDWDAEAPLADTDLGPLDIQAMPLTIEAMEAGAQVTFTFASVVTDGSVEYRTWNGTAWSDWVAYPGGTIVKLAAAGDKLQLRGDNAAYAAGSDYSNILFDMDCYVYGNIMSLITSTGFSAATELTGSMTFARLFFNNDHLKSHATNQLLLPATTLAANCYAHMFDGCTSLTTALALPAETLAYKCYQNMFYGCTSLTAAPVLPATTLAASCYTCMFDGCTNLTLAPALPAETLAESCYSCMFEGCTSLTAAPALPATTLATFCYANMFEGCTSLTTAPALPAETLAQSCYGYMFHGCTSLTAAPVLLATTLAESCCESMFENCTSLAAAPALPATTLAKNCYAYMFKGCTSLTTAPALPATILANYCYINMFNGCTSLTTAPSLSAETLAQGCYSFMFYDCTSLTIAPALPAETLAENCYEGLFYGCTSLTTAPALPATSLARMCYAHMFDGCTSLTTAPSLPAETLAEFCYGGMFVDCDNLTKAPALPAKTLAEFCYSGMFAYCDKLTTAPELSATSLKQVCYSEMFIGCKNLIAAPELPAPVLVYSCYSNMFSGCESLASVTCLATDISAEDCTTDWLKGAGTNVTVTPKVYTPASMASVWPTNSDSGIPTGWTRVDAP